MCLLSVSGDSFFVRKLLQYFSPYIISGNTPMRKVAVLMRNTLQINVVDHNNVVCHMLLTINVHVY